MRVANEPARDVCRRLSVRQCFAPRALIWSRSGTLAVQTLDAARTLPESLCPARLRVTVRRAGPGATVNAVVPDASPGAAAWMVIGPATKPVTLVAAVPA